MLCCPNLIRRLAIALLPVILAACGGSEGTSHTSGTENGAPTMRRQAIAAPSAARWSPLRALPLVPVSMANLPDGKVLMWSAEEKFSFGAATGRTYSATYDPATDTVTERTVTETGHNMFCPGTTNLADGRLLVNGGISASRTSIFDPATGQWSTGASMNIPRGYQANTLLSDGSVLTLGGSWSGGVGNKHGEVWTASAGWRRLSGVPVDAMLSPDPSRNFGGDSHYWLIPTGNGQVLYAGPGVNMQWIDTNGTGAVTPAGRRGDDEFSVSGTAVMYEAGKILKTGGGPAYDSVNANANTYIIDTTAGLTVRKLAPMAYRRAFHNSVVLPNGQVVVIGGQTYAVGFSDNNSVLVPELWDPATESFTPLPPISAPRNYHSVALLLPDGRVLSAGGGLCGAGCAANHPDLQILSPHYLFKPDGTPATRPVITSAPARLQYGQKVTVQADSAIASMAIVRQSSTTHTVNNDQRRLSLSFRATGPNTYEVDVPSNPGLALPGDWMLFAMNADGTPSVAKIVRIVREGAPTIAPIADVNASTAGPLSVQPSVSLPTGATATYSASGLPAGLVIDSATGRISGTPTATGSFTVTVVASAGGVSVSQVFRLTVNAPGSTRYVRLEALSEVGGNPWASAAEVSLLGASGQPLPRTGWVARADSQETAATNNAAGNAIDGNPATIWHTQYASASPGMPHWLTIDLGAGTEVTGLSYLPRQDASANGTIASYRVYLSTDGVNWGAPVASGNFSDLASGQAARLVYFRNLARGKPASQSSNLNALSTAGLATDGNSDGNFANGSVSHTANEANPWWEVDLGASNALQAVRLWNRTDCCAARLSNFYVFSSDTPMAGRSLAQLLADASVWRSQFGGTAGRSVLIDTAGTRGRYLRVQLAGTEHLQLAEVEVHGAPSANRLPTINTPPATSSVQGNPASVTVTAADADGDLLTFSAAGLPPGLAIAPGTGVISGAATAAGSYAVTVVVDDGRGGSAATQFSWVVQPAAPQLLPVATAPAAAGTAVNYTADTAAAGAYSFQWDFGDGTAPTAWSAANAASHVFAAPGVYQVTVTARTADGRSASRLFWQAVQGSITNQGGRSSSPILVESRTGAPARVWVVNPDNDSVTVFDAAMNTRLAEIPVGTRPRTLAQAPDGRIWVVNQGSASLSIVSPASLAVVQTVAMGRASQPFGIVVAADGSAYVTEEASGRIVRLSATGVAAATAAAAGPNVRHLAINATGTHLLAARFITPALPGEGTATVQTSVSGAPRGGELVLVATSGMVVQRTVVLRHSDKPDNTVQGRGVPNYLGAPVVSPDGRSIWVPSKQDNIQRGMLRDGQQLDFQNTVRAISSRIDLATLAEDVAARVDHDNSGVASAAAYHPGGAYLFVALETSRHVAVVDPVGKRELFRVDVGRAPQGLAVSADGLSLYVHNFMDRSVSVLDLGRLISFGESTLPAKATMTAVATEKLAPAVLKGKQFFYDARDPRLARDAYISCAACHADGGHDGRTWDFTGVGEGLRNTPPLRGRAGAQGRLHWSANFDEVQDFEGQIRNLSQGAGLMSDALFNAGTRAQPLGDAKAGLSADLDALAAYVASLNAFDPTPWRGAGGVLSASASAGRTVFALQCTACHGGTDFTSSADGQLKDIGTLKPSSGKRLGGPLAGIDPPTLRDAWATAPYLHDGSAATIEDAVRAHTGITLTAADLASVSAFVREIGREEAAVTPQVPASFRSSAVFGLASGTAFTDTVVSGQVLTGLSVRHWPAIYMIQGLATPSNLAANGSTTAGTPASVNLTAGEHLVRVYGRFDANGINQLAFVTSTGRTLGPGGSDPTPATSTPFDFTVPAGSRIVGFTGRAGTQLTAIGVLYTP